MTEKTCEKCLFWKRGHWDATNRVWTWIIEGPRWINSEGYTISAGNYPLQIGDCRKNAPRPAAFEYGPVWAATRDLDGCAEWKGKEE